MSTIYTPHQNSQSLARGLQPQMETALPPVACMPWNRYDWIEGEWLMSPVKKFPFYRPCKYFTMMDGTDHVERCLRAGVYVEKGFGEDRTPRSPNMLMGKDWGWPTFLDGIRSGAIPAILNGFTGSCRAQTTLTLFGGYDDSEGDLIEETFGEYEISLNEDNSLSLVVVESSKETAPLGTVKNWKDLSTALDVLTRDGWLWLNFYLSLSMPIAPRTGKPKGEVWTDDLVWTRFLKPFLPWITVK